MYGVLVLYVGLVLARGFVVFLVGCGCAWVVHGLWWVGIVFWSVARGDSVFFIGTGSTWFFFHWLQGMVAYT